MFAMCVDNIFWISSAPEYPRFKKMTRAEKLIYIVEKRIIPVLTDWRDIIPALLTSGILTGVLQYFF
jgi:hypothetical protein